jgi:glycosyltransferase involved in cell wall biosynthesis
MAKPTITLAIICRNEAHVIERCLRSVKPHISHWCVVDTGSTDGTQDVVRRELAGVPGELYERPWGRVSDSWLRRLLGKRDVDFSHNRNESLELARPFGDDYLLTLDADEELIADPGAFDSLTLDAYQVRFELVGNDGIWPRKLLLKSDFPWAYQDALHEHLTVPGAKVGHLDGVTVKSHHDSARNQDPPEVKYAKDAAVLARELKRRPEHKRGWFYYGQSLGSVAFAGGGGVDKAIAAYRKRISFGDVENEEVFYSLLQIAALKDFRQDPLPEVSQAYLDAYSARPTRAEPLYVLAVLNNMIGKPAAAELFARAACRLPRPPDVYMVNESVYQYRAAWELANALVKMGRLDETRKIFERLVTLDFVPESAKAEARINLALLNEAA